MIRLVSDQGSSSRSPARGIESVALLQLAHTQDGAIEQTTVTTSGNHGHPAKGRKGRRSFAEPLLKTPGRSLGRQQRGFTLIEMIVTIAILGILAAVAVPSVRWYLNRGASGALDTDQELLQQAVDAFRSDRHQGPNGSNLWGQVSPAQRLYPTRNGLVGDLELGTATDPAFADLANLKVHVYAAGSSVGAAATGTSITAGAVWVGLLVNEPVAAGAENDKPGLAHPLANEKGQYLLEFPESASETNTDIDTTAGNLNGKTNGSYTWIVLHNGRVVPAYLGEDGNWYSGSNTQYP